MRLATWNVNGLRARLDLVLRWLEARRPDLVALQELKLTDDVFPRAEIEALGYRAAVHGQKAWNGVAVLARGSIESTEVGLPGQEASGARLIAVDSGGITFASVYVPNGKSVEHEDYPRKLAWLDALSDHLAARLAGGGSLVIGGDFNVCPAPIDSWDEAMLAGTIFHTDEERARIGGLLDRGLRDVYRVLHPTERAFSWWDYRGGAFHRGHGLRIDLVLATEDVTRRARAVEVDRDYRKKVDGLTPSDHAPVLVDLD